MAASFHMDSDFISEEGPVSIGYIQTDEGEDYQVLLSSSKRLDERRKKKAGAILSAFIQAQMKNPFPQAFRRGSMIVLDAKGTMQGGAFAGKVAKLWKELERGVFSVDSSFQVVLLERSGYPWWNRWKRWLLGKSEIEIISSFVHHTRSGAFNLAFQDLSRMKGKNGLDYGKEVLKGVLVTGSLVEQCLQMKKGKARALFMEKLLQLCKEAIWQGRFDVVLQALREKKIDSWPLIEDWIEKEKEVKDLLDKLQKIPNEEALQWRLETIFLKELTMAQGSYQEMLQLIRTKLKEPLKQKLVQRLMDGCARESIPFPKD